MINWNQPIIPRINPGIENMINKALSDLSHKNEIKHKKKDKKNDNNL